MTSVLNDQSLDQIFCSARTPNGSTDRAVEENTVREIYDLMKSGPTSANSSPARFVWVRSTDGKATLSGLAAEPNKPKLWTDADRLFAVFGLVAAEPAQGS
jgi:3-hydroxypropanoate dehydrogenase